MLNVNEYFEGRVKSIAFDNSQGTATVGVMEPGDYEFSTAKAEIMQVVSGALSVRLPEQENWQTFAAGSRFDVPANSRFQVQISEQSAYLCYYLDEVDA